MSNIRYQKRGNKFYVYEIIQHWDKELKKPKQISKYLGIAAVKGGEYKKTGRKPVRGKLENAILDFGDSFAINEVAKNIGLDKIIQESFGDLSDSIMSLVCYHMAEGSAMQNCDDWIEGNIANKLYPMAQIKPQDINSLINHLGEQELQQRFFKNYVAKFFSNKKGLLIDSTALPNAINRNSSINGFGYSNNNDINDPVTCLMLVDKASTLPMYFRAIAGDMSDSASFKKTNSELKLLDLNVGSALLDADYCSKANLLYLCKENMDFVARLSRRHDVFYELIDNAHFVQSDKNVVRYRDRTLYIESRDVTIYGEKMFAHIILDSSKKEKDTTRILKDKLSEVQTDKQIDEIKYRIKYSGFLILLSKSKMQRQDILPTYYQRQTLEQVFDFSKSNNDLLSLGIRTEQSINGYLMLVFLSLILFVTMRQRLLPGITMAQALLRLKSLKAKIYDTEILVSEPNKKVKDIVRALGIIMPIVLEI